jgi:hypothetical protein
MAKSFVSGARRKHFLERVEHGGKLSVVSCQECVAGHVWRCAGFSYLQLTALHPRGTMFLTTDN